MLDVLVAIAIIAFVISRQFLGGPLRGRRLLLLPVVLVVVGASRLGGHHAGAMDVVILTVSGFVAVAIGVRQGMVMQLENRGGGLWARMPLHGLFLWVALIATRLMTMAAAHASGAHLAASLTPLVLMLGINRLAQALVVARRAHVAGIPFAPERNGTVYTPDWSMAGRAHSTHQARRAARRRSRV